MQRGSAQLLLILLLVLIGVGGFLFFTQVKPQTNPSSVNYLSKVENKLTNSENSFQTYSNKEFNFKFQYAKDLIAKPDSEEEFNQRGGGDFRKNFKGYVTYEPGKFLAGVVVLDKDLSYEQNPLALWIFDNPDNLSIDAWYKNYWYYPFVWGDFTYTGKFELAPKTEATVSGSLAKSGMIDYQPGKPKFVYLSRSKKMYLFRIIGESGDKILQSFKFN